MVQKLKCTMSQDLSTKLTIEIETLPNKSDFLKVVSCIIKFFIVERQQIPSNSSYDVIKKSVSSGQLHQATSLADKFDAKDGDILPSASDKSLSRLNMRRVRAVARNELKLKNYVDKMESLFKEINEVVSQDNCHEELQILFGATVHIAKYIVIIQIPQFHNKQDGNIPLKKLLPSVLSALLSRNGSGKFFEKNLPITNLHTCLKTRHPLNLPRVHGQVGTSKSHFLAINFILKPTIPTAISFHDNLESITEDFGRLLTPLANEVSEELQRKKPARRLFFSTPTNRALPVTSTPCMSSRLSGGNISGVASLDSWSDDTSSEVTPVESELYYYRIFEPVKGLKLIGVSGS